MPSISIEEHELLDFFGVEPTIKCAESSWPYNEYLYSLTRGSTSVSFTIEPAWNDLRITLKNREVTFYELRALDSQDAFYRNDNGRETLEIVLADGNRLWLGLYPNVTIHHDFINR